MGRETPALAALATPSANRTDAQKMELARFVLRDAIVAPAVQLVDRLLEEGAETAYHEIAGLGHALAAEPGFEAAEQLPLAAEVDAIVTAWLRARLENPLLRPGEGS